MEAFAQSISSNSSPDGGILGSLVPFILIFIIFYLLIIRPQSKKLKEHKAMTDELAVGNIVVTQGGLKGKVAKTPKKDDEAGFINIEIAEGVIIQAVRSTISEQIVTEKK